MISLGRLARLQIGATGDHLLHSSSSSIGACLECRMSTWAPTSVLLKGLRHRLRGFTPISLSNRQTDSRHASTYVLRLLKGGCRGDDAHATICHSRQRLQSPCLFTLGSTSRRRSSSAVLKRANSAAHPRFVLQQNLAKCARDAEASNVPFPSKESLDEVEEILG